MQTANEPAALKILAVVEATTVNAVAKHMLEFHRAACNLKQKNPDSLPIETSLITFDRRDSTESPKEFVRSARALGLEVHIIPERFRFDPLVIPLLRKIVEHSAPDIVLTHQVKSHLLMRLSRLGERYPWVAFHHGYTTTDQKMRAYNQLNRWSLPRADKVITVCEAFARELTAAGVSRERIHVQHNSIRPEEPASAQETEALIARLGIAPGTSILLTVGRLSREKAHLDLLAAFKQLREINREIAVSLLIVGDGPERKSLQAAVRSMGLSGFVLFTGEVRNVQPYYGAADVFVLPSHSEGSPYVLLEAMAAKLPVVATSVGGVPEMVDNEVSALLVPPGDPSAMAAALARILTGPELADKLTENASALAATRYSPESHAESLLKIYQELVSHKKSLSADE
jgi:glycosyltransferase involved in cell wall biosynthesis